MQTEMESNDASNLNRAKILIVDDDPVFISQLAQILIERGYLVLGAKDALSALGLLNQHELNFSLAIIDVFMPMGGGFELRAADPAETRDQLEGRALALRKKKDCSIARAVASNAWC